MSATRCLVLAALVAFVGETSGCETGSCPEDKPSGECDTVGLRCDHNDEQGCPHFYVCSANHGPVALWAETMPRAGGPCTNPGQICAYSAAQLDAEAEDQGLECGPSGTWESKSLCPEQLPMDGSLCEHFIYCWYGCPETPDHWTQAICQYRWTVTDSCPNAGG